MIRTKRSFIKVIRGFFPLRLSAKSHILDTRRFGIGFICHTISRSVTIDILIMNQILSLLSFISLEGLINHGKEIILFSHSALPEAEIIVDAACVASPDPKAQQAALETLKSVQIAVLPADAGEISPKA